MTHHVKKYNPQILSRAHQFRCIYTVPVHVVEWLGYFTVTLRTPVMSPLSSDFGLCVADPQTYFSIISCVWALISDRSPGVVHPAGGQQRTTPAECPTFHYLCIMSKRRSHTSENYFSACFDHTVVLY